MISKYLSNLGIKENQLPWNWCPNDERESDWKKEKKIYGFDSRDTWALNYTLALLIYPRLKMYNEVNIIDTNFHKFTFKDKEYTYQECIDKVLRGLEIFLTKNDSEIIDEEMEEIQDAIKLLGEIWWALWW